MRREPVGERRLRYADVRPYAAPDDLAQLDGPVAGEVELPRTLAWGPKRRFQLNDPRDRQRLYQMVIREASTVGELTRYLNGSSPDCVGSGECWDYAGVGLVTVGRGSLPAMR